MGYTVMKNQYAHVITAFFPSCNVIDSNALAIAHTDMKYTMLILVLIWNKPWIIMYIEVSWNKS